ncbi:MAG: DUF6931 family protein [Planctomycetota bacterium]|jgi:hypothetical protein
MKKLREIFGFGDGSPRIVEPFIMISGRTVPEICGDFELQEEAKAHLNGDPAPHEFVDRLIRADLYADATRFLTYGLPKRQAVWWSCLCVRSVSACYGDQISAEVLQAAEAWVKDPVETNRKAALLAGGKHNFEMPSAPAAWTAMAAGWSGGVPSAGEEDMPALPEHLTAHAASGAMLLAATIEPDQAKEMYRKFLETGVQIAQGKMQILS